MSNEDGRRRLVPYQGGLTPEQAATAMQAARLNALDLLETAEILIDLKRFAHSVAFSILAVEEASKNPLLLGILLGFENREGLWRAYRTHKAKTQFLNPGIRDRIRVTFPEFPLEMAKDIGQRGPTPDDLEIQKQRAFYSDCLKADGRAQVHLPRNLDWRQIAWERLCEAKALVQPIRDYSPEELKIWLKHAKEAQKNGGTFATVLEPLYKELLAEGFVKEGSWTTILADTNQKLEND